jgi:hypothetical protein
MVVAGCEAVAPAPQAKIVFTPEATQTAAPSAPSRTVLANPPPEPLPPAPLPSGGAVPKVETEILPPQAAPAPLSAPVPPIAAPSHPGLHNAAADGSRGLRVALLVPLSGPNAALGALLSNAAQLALFDTEDNHLELQPIDTKGSAQGAVAAIGAAIEQGADVVLGPVFSTEVKAIAPMAQEHHLPVLSFTTDKSAVGKGVYTLGLLPHSQLDRMFEAIKAEGRTRVAVLAPDTDFGHALAEAAQAGAQAEGLTLTKLQFYPTTQTDFRALAQSFANYSGRKAALAQEKNLLSGRGPKPDVQMAAAAMPFDALLIPDEGLRLKNLVSLLTYYGIDPGPVRFLGTMRWEDRSIADEPMLQGGWYAAPGQAGLDVFETHYVKTFGPIPKTLISLAGESYDGLALIALLDKKGVGQPPEQRVAPEKLTDPEGFSGVVGLFRLRPDGENDRGLAVREVAAGGNTEAIAAPASFAPQH